MKRPAYHGEAELSALRRLVEGRRVDGMIVVRTLRHDPRVEYLREQNMPFVCHGRTENAGDYAFVGMDGQAACHLATETLIELGHRNTTYIGPQSSILICARHRRSVYAEALRHQDLPLRTGLIRRDSLGTAPA